MSQGNVESFKRGVDAFNRRDIAAFLAESHPDSVVYASMAAMLRGEETELHGHDEYVIEFRDGKAARVDDYFDPAEALAEVDPG